ncbi:hypothetical protein V8B55DRAFT_1539822 [Mucor lusitanicus]|uniref:Uncharacterized protein n=2 Tax=Mucor circinelloides f. lusitanicus TaxID=29924 RepID=A0A168N9V0_MUCCL|nr:hypothetical protein FB192DRAFT_1387512 [Mucor lusitanicus]OAD05994.1 hypothetical protein MUCCIDRAFT_155206 [Mucor lusitanicus CBS 277.49]
MANSFNTGDANVPLEQDQDAIQLTSHASETHTTTIVTPEKHLLYVEDYDSMPPAYSDTQQQQQQQGQHTSSEAMLGDDDYSSRSNQESEPLMAADEAEAGHYRYPPTAPSIDQMEFGLHRNSFSNPKTTRKRKGCSFYRAYLAFAVFAIGITLMSAALATIDCYNGCEEKQSCDRCPRVRRDGFTAFCYITFILSSIAMIGKAAQCVLS